MVSPNTEPAKSANAVAFCATSLNVIFSVIVLGSLKAFAYHSAVASTWALCAVVAVKLRTPYKAIEEAFVLVAEVAEPVMVAELYKRLLLLDSLRLIVW